jgi:hypothetical protein
MKNEKGNAVQFVYEWADKYGSPAVYSIIGCPFFGININNLNNK